jgi:hypothetical protein
LLTQGLPASTEEALLAKQHAEQEAALLNRRGLLSKSRTVVTASSVACCSYSGSRLQAAAVFDVAVLLAQQCFFCVENVPRSSSCCFRIRCVGNIGLAVGPAFLQAAAELHIFCC